MRQKDMKFIKCLNKICTTVPLAGSQEDTMLQSCELKLNPNHENYPHDAMHVYAQNVHMIYGMKIDLNCCQEKNTPI